MLFAHVKAGLHTSPLFAQFAAYDEGQDQAVLEKIRGILNRRKYIRNLVGQVEKALTPPTTDNGQPTTVL